MSSATGPIHQISYSERNVGSNNPESKKEVIFRFSIPQQQKEYEVVFKWSFSSGKQAVTVNDQGEFFSKVKGASIFDKKINCLPANDDLELHLIGTRTKPKGAASLTYRCFELIINQTTLFSACPAASGSQQPYQGGESILDLLYPDHPCRNQRQQQNSGNGYQQQQHSGGYQQNNGGGQQHLSAPIENYVNAAPKAAEAPDLLLDMNTAPDACAAPQQSGTNNMFTPSDQNMVPAPAQVPTASYDPFGVSAPAAAYYNGGAPQAPAYNNVGGPSAAPAYGNPPLGAAPPAAPPAQPAFDNFDAFAGAPATATPSTAPPAAQPAAYIPFDAHLASSSAAAAPTAPLAYSNFSVFDTPTQAPPAANPFDATPTQQQPPAAVNPFDSM